MKQRHAARVFWPAVKQQHWRAFVRSRLLKNNFEKVGAEGIYSTGKSALPMRGPSCLSIWSGI